MAEPLGKVIEFRCSVNGDGRGQKARLVLSLKCFLLNGSVVQNLPAELLYPTIEYILPPTLSLPSGAAAAGGTQVLPPPLFVLVLDTCVIEEEIEQLKDSLLQVGGACWGGRIHYL